MRLLADTALIALVAPAAFLKVETILAPYEWYVGAKPAQVTAWIASDRDWDRLQAWARLVTMPRSDKEEVAKALAPLLLGHDEAARHSALLTLGVPLRQFSLAALTSLRPELEAYLRARAAGTQPSFEAEHAGLFAEAFVRKNVGSIHKALDKDKRALLPDGGLGALFLALATEPTIGPIYLGELERHGDEVEKPLAQSVLHLAAIRIPSKATPH